MRAMAVIRRAVPFDIMGQPFTIFRSNGSWSDDGRPGVLTGLPCFFGFALIRLDPAQTRLRPIQSWSRPDVLVWVGLAARLDSLFRCLVRSQRTLTEFGHPCFIAGKVNFLLLFL